MLFPSHTLVQVPTSSAGSGLAEAVGEGLAEGEADADAESPAVAALESPLDPLEMLIPTSRPLSEAFPHPEAHENTVIAQIRRTKVLRVVPINPFTVSAPFSTSNDSALPD